MQLFYTKTLCSLCPKGAIFALDIFKDYQYLMHVLKAEISLKFLLPSGCDKDKN